jgi:hypothetical protein
MKKSQNKNLQTKENINKLKNYWKMKIFKGNASFFSVYAISANANMYIHCPNPYHLIGSPGRAFSSVSSSK